jgi:hypothetical protein
MVRPSIGDDPYRVRAPVVGAKHQQAANAGRSHFPEGVFLLACKLGHASNIRETATAPFAPNQSRLFQGG